MAAPKKKSAKAKPKPRLNRRDWLDAALSVLVHEGINAVTIERLASSLGVTRGSFYHHFEDRAELLQSILEYWQAEATGRVREQVEALQLDPRTTLLALSRAIRHSKAAQFDVAFRNWALHDEQAMALVRKTDEMRLGFIREQFRKAGYEGRDLENRARLFYYYELADPMVFTKQSDALEDALVEVRHRLLTAPSEDS